MESLKVEQSEPLAPAAARSTENARRRLIAFALIATAVCALFSGPLMNWARCALSAERNTYLLLVPFVSAYLIRSKRGELRGNFRSSIALAVIPLLLGIAAIGLAFNVIDPLDRLSAQIFALVSFLFAGALVFVGSQILRQIAFPVAFLLFAVPIPSVVAEHIEVFLQHTSAEAAYWMMSVARIPMIRDGVNFRLPNIYIQVAQECSGYNSTFSLFMVSCVAGYWFLKSFTTRTILALAIIPLAILRNGFRITTLAALCVYDDPSWIDSSLHHKGGPIFFVLSLIPFFLILWGLRRYELAKAKTK